MGITTCTFEGCTIPHYAKGLCRAHYEQNRRGTPLTLERGQYSAEVFVCAAPGCSETFRQRARGSKRLYCSRLCRDRIDKAQQRASGWVPVHQRADSPRCTVDGCDGASFSFSMCVKHYNRFKKHGDPNIVLHDRRPGEWRSGKQGYVYRFMDGVKQLQHREVMAEMIGRPLETYESPHHRNGRRDDNRPENLELWVKPQPSGQRVEDLVAWVIDHYPLQLQEALALRS